MRWIWIPLLALAAPAAAITPLAEFDAKRYQGRWYEIAAIPGAFRNQCQRDVQVEYAAEDGGAFVMRNSCRRPDGDMMQSEGRGRALDPDVPSVLKVTFVYGLGIWWYPFGRNQTVIAAGPEYRWLVIGDTSLRYGRVLAREPALDDKAMRAVDAVLAAEGYDRCTFILKPQAGGRGETRRFCDEVRAP
jgi:apolipoprotein D and lipocalin family protein